MAARLGSLRNLAFMRPGDITLFLQGARVDATIERLQREQGCRQAMEAVYAEGDPWLSADRRFAYQRRKYDVIAGLLPCRRFGRALDLGCGLGGFTRLVADRSDHVLGMDISQQAVAQASARHGRVAHMQFCQGDLLSLPEELDGALDLVTVVDTLYYLPPPICDDALKAAAARLGRLLRPGGVLLLANHYVAPFERLSRLTRRIQSAFTWAPSLRLLSRHRHPFYVTSLFGPAADAVPLAPAHLAGAVPAAIPGGLAV